MKTTDDPIIVKQVFYHTTAQQLWNAITSPEEMRDWFFRNIPNFIAKPSFKTQFPVHSEDRIFTHLWDVIEVIAYQKIILNWKYKEYPGDSLVTFEIREWQDHLELEVKVNVIEDFPGEIPEFSRTSCLNGWKYFIVENLKNHIERKELESDQNLSGKS